jgi:myo-inositol-1(or 4)-monophosphatase
MGLGPAVGDPIDLDALDGIVSPLIIEAGKIAMRWFRSPLVTEDKGGEQGFDPVTKADRMTESYLRRELSGLFPDSQIVGEEAGSTGPTGRVQWVIDPIDGTKSYVTGVPLWGVLLGLVVDGRPIAGWCRQPFLDETFAAIGSEGWLERDGDRRALKTSRTTDVDRATLYATHPSMFVEPWHRVAFERLSRQVRMQRFGGDCYSYCLLALGHIDLVVESSLQPYDIIPLVPIVEAAGGVVTGPDGEPPVDGGFVIAAASAQLHRQVLDIAAAARAESETPTRRTRRE